MKRFRERYMWLL